ncbi:MAG: HlyD family efflux transporter periplasmic adaptor subunit [Lachnospiraceae bacterium]|nr:HlyD family efflux transporter periplasmic adaptor subunit [Lachnospiraceae bacterium]
MNQEKDTGLNNKRNRTILGVIIAVIICIGAGVGIYELLFSEDANEEVYVSSVSGLMGNLENGMRNRFQGIVESNNSWTATLDGRPVKEYKVKVGDKVEVGTPLLVYDNSQKEEEIANARLELQRMQDERAAMNADIAELNTERNEATDDLAAEELAINIQQKQIDMRNKDTEIATKQEEVKNMEDSLASDTVTSEISGVVKSLGNETEEGESSGGLTIVDINTFQIKAKVNEQNLSSLYEGEKVIIFSRVSNDIHWKGKITNIDKENTLASAEEYDEDGDEMTVSSNYPFYISLKKTEGLAVGQHVYVEENVGQLKKNPEEVIELDSYMIVDLETDDPYVWADNGSGRLEKRSVTLGEYNEDADRYRIEDGITMADYLAQPDENVHAGMKTVDMNAKDDDENAEDDEDSDDEEDDEEDDE